MGVLMDEITIDKEAMDESFEIVLIFDEQGMILWGNRTAVENLDYSVSELSQRNMAEILWQEFQREDGTFAAFDVEKLKENSETVLYRKNSSCFPIEFRIYAKEKDKNYFLARDITWKKNLDVRIWNLKKEGELNQQRRNEFTANVTHELRTPVNGIKGHVLSLLDSVAEEQQKRTLEIILYCCDNMSAIINNILDFSKIEAGKFTINEEEFDFYKMIDQVLATHTAEINKKELRLSVFVDEAVPQYIVGDALRISQILNNLLSNAVKFTSMGQISVDISKTMQSGEEIELFFMVKDSGIGISKEDQDKLFESFNQVDASITRRFGGTGLGLSITKQLVEMMQGTIHVESEKGKGSTFSFHIRVHINKSRDLKETYQKWSNLTVQQETEEPGEDFLEFGTEENKAELAKRMEKLVLCIELGSWDKAENLAENIKLLLQDGGDDCRRASLRMEMAIRKEDYDKCMKAYETLKEVLESCM